MPTLGKVEEPLRGYNFRVEIGSASVAHFIYCAGLGMVRAVINYREAGEKQIMRKLAGQIDFSPITLSSGVTKSREIFDWMLPPRGDIDRREVSIVLMDNIGVKEVLRFNLSRCWVCAMQGPTLDTMSNSLAIKTITLAYESLELK